MSDINNRNEESVSLPNVMVGDVSAIAPRTGYQVYGLSRNYNRDGKVFTPVVTTVEVQKALIFTWED